MSPTNEPPAASLRDRALARLVKFPASQYEGGIAEAAVMALMDAEREIDSQRQRYGDSGAALAAYHDEADARTNREVDGS